MRWIDDDDDVAGGSGIVSRRFAERVGVTEGAGARDADETPVAADVGAAGGEGVSERTGVSTSSLRCTAQATGPTATGATIGTEIGKLWAEQAGRDCGRSGVWLRGSVELLLSPLPMLWAV